MKSKVLILLVLIEGPFLTFGSGHCRTVTLYPFGSARSDQQQTEGDDSQYRVLQTGVNFPVFGKTYNKIFISINGIISFGTALTDPAPPDHVTYIPYAAAYWSDVLLSLRVGRFYFRKVNLTEEQDVAAMIERDSFAIGEPITPELVAVITWYKVSSLSVGSLETNTFQIVLASDGNKTIAVFNYDTIQWNGGDGDYFAAVRYGNTAGQVLKYSIDLTQEMINIIHYSTIGVPGRIVNRIDGNYPLLPLFKYSCSKCAIDTYNGSVVTFDGSPEMATNASNRKYLISKVNQADGSNKHDQCKYMLRAATDENGHTDWVGFSVGVHPKNPSKYKRNFAFERHNANSVIARGHHLKMTIKHFPYIERIRDNGQNLVVVIEKTAVGWIVRSPTCPYVMEYSPKNDDQQLSLYLGVYYKGKTIGICQNFNDHVADDSLDCHSPPRIADASAIGQSCSCPISKKACNKVLQKL